jgi:hypothetical protein
MERSCHVKLDLNSVAAKNLTARASAGRPIDLVTVAGVVKAQKVWQVALNMLLKTLGLITELSGLPKAIKPTIRVSCWAKIKTVLIAGMVTLRENLKVPAKETDWS